MIKESTIATRGQVFYYNPVWGLYGRGNEPKNHQSNGSLEFKKRPYLIISNDKGNFSSPTCNVIPITTRDNIVIPSQVKFVFNGRNQVILTEQITTCNVKDLGEYCYTVSEEILDKVQQGLQIQFGMKFNTPEVTMEELTTKLESVVNKVIENVRRKSQSVIVSQSVMEDFAIKLGSMVEDLVSTPKSDITPTTAPNTLTDTVPTVSGNILASDKVVETKVETRPIKPIPHRTVDRKSQPTTVSQNASKTTPTPNYANMSQIEKFNARMEKCSTVSNKGNNPSPTNGIKPQESTETSSNTNKKQRKQPWDIEKQKQFLADCDKLNPDELMEKYGFNTKKDLYNHKYLIRNRIENCDK